MIVLVLGAGTDYGLFLVFRVREALRAGQHATAGEYYPGARGLGGSLLGDFLHPRAPAREAIVGSVTKVGESITFSAATVIAAMLTLLLASFSFYADLGGPFAIAIAVTLIAALTLLPALLSIRLSLLAAKRSLFRAMFKRPKLLPWNIQGSGKPGVWGRVAGRIVKHPIPTLVSGSWCSAGWRSRCSATRRPVSAGTPPRPPAPTPPPARRSSPGTSRSPRPTRPR